MPKSRIDMVLAGDVGGTNARFRLYNLEVTKILDDQIFSSQSQRSLATLLGPYVRAAPGRICAAALGIAGPVVDGVSKTTNLPWVVDERKLARALGIPAVQLVNDLAAIAMGCTRIRPAARTVISKGQPPKGGNAAVISAGTGLGEALLVWDSGRYCPSPTEGGHSDFAPRNDTEIELLRFLQKGDPSAHVSYERVLSGPGMSNIYDFFLQRDGAEESEKAERALQAGDRNAAIARLGLTRKSPTAVQTVDTFAAIYGAEVGNLALRGLAVRGVYVCGRIAAEIIPKRKKIFLDAMRDKGRLRPLVERVPVYLVEDELVGLVGAGHLAARRAVEL